MDDCLLHYCVYYYGMIYLLYNSIYIITNHFHFIIYVIITVRKTEKNNFFNYFKTRIEFYLLLPQQGDSINLRSQELFNKILLPGCRMLTSKVRITLLLLIPTSYLIIYLS